GESTGRCPHEQRSHGSQRSIDSTRSCRRSWYLLTAARGDAMIAMYRDYVQTLQRRAAARNSRARSNSWARRNTGPQRERAIDEGCRSTGRRPRRRDRRRGLRSGSDAAALDDTNDWVAEHSVGTRGAVGQSLIEIRAVGPETYFHRAGERAERAFR